MACDNDKPANTQFRKGHWYWEPPAKTRKLTGVKGRALGGDQPSAWAAARSLNRELAGLRIGQHLAGTVGWVFDQFFDSDKFKGTDKIKGLAKSTQTDYRWLAKRIGRVKLGERLLADINVVAIRARHADAIFKIISAESGHSTGHYCARFARRVWKWAGRKEFVNRADNPWSGMELAGLQEREEVWTPAEVATVIAKAHEMNFASIGLACHIAYAFAHRKNDILTLTWTALNTGLRKTSKTGVTLPMVEASYPDLKKALDAERARQAASTTPSTHVVVCEMTYRPWHPDVFAHHFRTVANAAGIRKELQFRDLRATATTELKDAGADILDMSTHNGHKTVTMARRYARPTADQFQRAAAKRQAHKALQAEDGQGGETSEIKDAT